MDGTSGLMDTPILGAGDHHMALALIGQCNRSMPGGITQEYRKAITDWQDNALHFIKKDIGYVPGTICHYFHGTKASRKYVERWDILTKNKFNPLTDIRKDSQGLWQINEKNDRQIRLRDEIRMYFRQRNEDGGF
jgi:hypothetical protein